ncbi:MAG: mechanosensitive ion channel family protein [Gammaproteobacteria bacterium]
MEWLKEIDLANVQLQNLAVVGIEIIALIVLYFILSIAIRFIQNKAQSSTSLMQHEKRITGFCKLFRLILRLLLFVGILAVVGLNGYQWYLGNDLKTYTFDLIQKIPPDFWKGLAISVAKVIGLIIAARYFIRFNERGINYVSDKAVNFDQIDDNDDSVAFFFSRLNSIQKVVVWLLVLYAANLLFGLPSTIGSYILIALKVYLIISVGLLVVNVMSVIVDTFDGISRRYAESNNQLLFYENLRHLIPLLRKTLEYILYAVVATMVLSQLSFISHLAEYGPGIIQGIGLFFIARVVIEVVNLLIDKVSNDETESEEEQQRKATIFPLFKSVLAWLIYFVVFVLILRGLGFDPIPLLAGAGILGMVIGLGAQSLVNDIISGFFIIFENTLRVGDYIEVQETVGTVESIGLRTTKIRGRDGQLFILRNGDMSDVVSYSRSFSNAVVTVGVDHESDIQKVYAVLNNIGDQIKKENADVLEQTRIDGLEDFNGPELLIRTVTKVNPGCHEEVERDLRMRMKEAFDQEGIIIPFDKRYQLA